MYVDIKRGDFMKVKKRLLILLSYIVIIAGSFIAGIGLEYFLVPNQILDGGVVGISIILSHITGLELGLFLIILNIPFLFLAYNQLGKDSVIKSIVGIIGLSSSTFIFHHVEPFTKDLLLATVFGGLFLGVGIGLVIKYGGALDGSEIFSLFINIKTGKPVAQVLLFINLIIFIIAGFVFGWEQAMYSVLAFYIAFKMIDVVLEGLDETKNVWIVSDKEEEIAEAIMKELGRGITYFKGEGAFTNEEKKIIFCVITRLEEVKLKDIVHRIDPDSFLAISNISEVHGVHFKKDSHH
jgi:uncharacterized membrane-anchored protein YitT (DUF2179 family)